MVLENLRSFIPIYTRLKKIITKSLVIHVCVRLMKLLSLIVPICTRLKEVYFKFNSLFTFVYG